MKTLYINRHAKSSWDNPRLNDFDRPLNKRGQKDAPKMGKVLNDKGIQPGLFLSSPANRAITTARLIAKEVDYPIADIEEDKRVYGASAHELIHILKEQDDEVESIILFGHNPELTTLANMLTGVAIDNIPTCGFVHIEFDVGNWSDIDHGRLVAFDYPKNHK